MSLHPHVIAPVPAETVRVARAAFPKGHPYLTFRDALGTIFQDEDFTALFPVWGQPGLPPWRLALVTIMQFREHLAERQAAEAVRARIDWKYLLSLELTDPGFDFSVLSEFRDRLLAGSAEELLLDKLLERCRALGLLKARGQQRTDSTHVLTAVRVLNRLELVAETLRAALNAVATVAPDWLQGFAPLEWYERYGKRIEDVRLPRDQADREAYAQMVGEDGFHFLDTVEAAEAPKEVQELPILERLRRTWQRHYERMGDAAPAGAGDAKRCVRFKANGSYRRPPRVSNRPTMPTRATATNATRPGPAIWCMSAKPASPLPPTSSRTSTRRLPPSMRRSVRPPSSKPSWTRSCLPVSTSSTRPISVPTCSSTAATSKGSPCEARHVRVRAGRCRSREPIRSSSLR
jgi:transposase